MGRFRPRADEGRQRRRQGSSLVELLLALVLFHVALLAVAPLFLRAVRDVRTGGIRSAASMWAQDRLEASPPRAAAVAAGRRTAVEYFSAETREWLAEPPPVDRLLWVRRTTVRRYPLSAIADGRIDPVESAARGDQPPRVVVAGVEVEITRRLGGPPIVILERLEWWVG